MYSYCRHPARASGEDAVSAWRLVHFFLARRFRGAARFSLCVPRSFETPPGGG